MAGNVASRLLGLLREQVMAWLFGATGATDAFVAASIVPTMVYDLLVGGAISAALVPVFVEASGDQARLWRLVSAVLSLVGLLVLTATVGLMLLADPLMSILGNGFSPAQHAEAVGMVRVMLVAVVLQGLAGVLMATLYAHNRFALPAFAPAAYNAGVIVLAVLLHQRLGVASLVVGVLVGALGQLALQLAGLRAFRYQPRLDLHLPEVRAILRLYAPVAAGMVVTIAGIVLDRYFASHLEAGSMTVMGYATRLIQFPLGLVATAISFAVLPTLSKHAAEPQPYRQTLSFGIKIVLLLMIPATLGLAVLAEPLVRLLFEHRAFTEYDTARTTGAFLFYAPQLPLTALDQLVIFAFYARRDTVTPVRIGVLSVLGFYLPVALLTKDTLGVNGLALANTAQNGGHGLVLLGLLWWRIGGLDARDLLGFTARVALAAGLMALTLRAAFGLLTPALAGGGTLGLLIVLGLAVVLGLGSFGLAVLALRLPEARQLWAMGRRGRSTEPCRPRPGCW